MICFRINLVVPPNIRVGAGLVQALASFLNAYLIVFGVWVIYSNYSFAEGSSNAITDKLLSERWVVMILTNRK